MGLPQAHEVTNGTQEYFIWYGQWGYLSCRELTTPWQSLRQCHPLLKQDCVSCPSRVLVQCTRAAPSCLGRAEQAFGPVREWWPRERQVIHSGKKVSGFTQVFTPFLRLYKQTAIVYVRDSSYFTVSLSLNYYEKTIPSTTHLPVLWYAGRRAGPAHFVAKDIWRHRCG